MVSDTGSIIPSKPVIARRNSAASNRHNGNNNNNNNTNNHHNNIDPLLLDSTSTSSISRGYGLTNNNTNSNNNDLIDYELANSIDYSENLFDTDRSGGKYDTVPNIRNSAKNRRKLEKIFSISSNNKKSSDESNSNSYLSKLRADKQSSNSESTTARNYSPSNPESGFFSISDVDYGENNRFIKQHQQQQLKSNSSNISSYSSSSSRRLDVITGTNSCNSAPAVNSSHLKSSSSLIDVVVCTPSPPLRAQSTNTHQTHNHHNGNYYGQESFIFPPRKPVLIKKSPSQTNLDASKSQQPQGQQSTSNLINGGSNSNNNNNLEYNPLAGVSFKQTHASDVEIVGVRLAAQNNEPNINAKKKNSLKSWHQFFYFRYLFFYNLADCLIIFEISKLLVIYKSEY